MKKTLALVLTFALVFSTFGMAFADTTTPAVTPAKALTDLKVLVGEGAGVTPEYLAKSPKRLQALKMVLILRGLYDEALAFTGTANFADATKNAGDAWGVPLMAYAKAHPELGWVGDGTNFAPGELMTVQQYAKVMLEALGYKQTTTAVAGDFVFADTLKFAASLGLNFTATTLTVDELANMTVATLKATVKDSTKTLVQNLVDNKKLDAAVVAADGLTTTAAVASAVTSVTATSAKTIKVTFDGAVADTAKAVFTVKKSSTAVTVTTTWNDAKTEATLTGASNFAEATYTVGVAYDSKDLGSKDVVFTAQKVAKIEFTSPNVAVTVANGTGYVTYKVYDQYNTDITNTAMANLLNPQVGVTSTNLTIKNGLMTIGGTVTPSLLTVQNLSVVLYDASAGVTATKSLPVSTTVGTLSDLTVGDTSNIKLVEGDTSSVFYVPYTAKDMAGNETKNYDLVRGGIIDSNTGTASVVDLVTSLSNVQAQVVKDPNNPKDAAIAVSYTGTSSYTMDMPVTITAMTYSGKSITVQTTISRGKALANFVLLAPADVVAKNDGSVTIPYEAYDQQGNPLTKWSDLNGKVTLGTGLTPSERGDGTFKVTFAPSAKGLVTLTATVPATGKTSMLSINVQDTAVPASISIDRTVLVTTMEKIPAGAGAKQNFDLGADNGGITVYDNYDRAISYQDFGSGDEYDGYTVDVSSTTGNVAVSGNTSLYDAYNDVATLTAAGVGSDTITVDLVKTATSAVVDSASVPVTVIDSSDIKDYTMDAVTAPIYTSLLAAGSAKDVDTRYDANPSVYGLTSSGTKVLLAMQPITSASLSNTTDFTFGKAFTTAGLVASYDGVTVNARKFLDPTKTGADTLLAVNVFHNGELHSLTTTIKSSTVDPVAKSIVTTDEVSGSNTITLSGLGSANGLDGKYFVDYDASGNTTSGNRAGFLFRISDQYGSRAMSFAQFKVVRATNGGAVTDLVVDPTGQVNASTTLVNGASYWLSAITNNGIVLTVKITIAF